MMKERTLAGLVIWVLGVCAACSESQSQTLAARPTPMLPQTTSQSAVVTKPAAPSVAAPGAVPVTASIARPVQRAVSEAARSSALQVRRFVVAPAVKDREPLVSTEALPSDGSAIYAFAELANAGETENVRITFERKGGAERVGDVVLPVPGDVPRHRTWAFTRFIRVPGVWEAVLWSESGRELGRTSFEVKQS